MSKIVNEYQVKKSSMSEMAFCYAYQEDLDQAYAFYCSRYENITYEEFLGLKLSEFQKKLCSVPKNEPLYDIIKSRTINISKIKDKEEKKYWLEQKRINKIPNAFYSSTELDNILKKSIRSDNLGGLNGKRFN